MSKIDCTCLILVALALVVAYVIFKNPPIAPGVQGCSASARRSTLSPIEEDLDVQNYTRRYNEGTQLAQGYRHASGGAVTNATPAPFPPDASDEQETYNKGQGAQSEPVKKAKAEAKMDSYTGTIVDGSGVKKMGKKTNILTHGDSKKYDSKDQEKVSGVLMSDYH